MDITDSSCLDYFEDKVDVIIFTQILGCSYAFFSNSC